MRSKLKKKMSGEKRRRPARPASAVGAAGFLKTFSDCQALLEGHFRLSSGLHSDRYVQCAKVLQYPEISESLAAKLARKWRGTKIDAVVGPAYGGIVLSYELARALGARALFTERLHGKMELRRGFGLRAGERVLVAEDVVTTGGSVKEVLDLVRVSRAVPVGVASLVDRGGGKGLGLPFRALLKVKAREYNELACPLCKRGRPLLIPGSRMSRESRVKNL